MADLNLPELPAGYRFKIDKTDRITQVCVYLQKRNAFGFYRTIDSQYAYIGNKITHRNNVEEAAKELSERERRRLEQEKISTMYKGVLK